MLADHMGPGSPPKSPGRARQAIENNRKTTVIRVNKCFALLHLYACVNCLNSFKFTKPVRSSSAIKL